jgi:hypothetical protein
LFESAFFIPRGPYAPGTQGFPGQNEAPATILILGLNDIKAFDLGPFQMETEAEPKKILTM